MLKVFPWCLQKVSNLWGAAINSLCMICLQCSEQQSPESCVIPDPSSLTLWDFPQEIQPIQTSLSKSKSLCNLLHITNYIIPSILPMEKKSMKYLFLLGKAFQVRLEEGMPWICSPAQRGKVRAHHPPGQVPPSHHPEWPSGPRWAPHGADPCPQLPLPLWPGETLWISQPLLPSVSVKGRISLLQFLCRLII